MIELIPLTVTLLVAAGYLGAELMYYGGTLADVALAVVLMTQWYQSTGRAWRREQRRTAAHTTAQGEQAPDTEVAWHVNC